MLEPDGKTPNPLKVALFNVVLGYLNDEQVLAKLVGEIGELVVTEEELRANTVPVLSIVGAKDPLREGIDALVGVMANHRAIYIEKADHMTAFNRREYIEALRGFLAEHSGETLAASQPVSKEN